MPKRSSKKRKQEEERDDPSVIAYEEVQQATWEDEGGDGNRNVEPPSEKNPAAVALGRLGGLSGGKGRGRRS